MATTDTKIILSESDIPTHYYNIAPDLPPPLPPPLNTATRSFSTSRATGTST